MAALVCGKRSFSFEDELETYYPSFKKHRCSSSYISPSISKDILINKLKQTFPLMEDQLLVNTLEDCNFNLDLTIAKLQELRLSQAQPEPNPKPDDITLGEEDLKWVELFVNEMSMATSVDDAKSRAASALIARDQDKTGPLKEQNLRLSQENCVLRRLVVAQHDRLKGVEETKKEAEKLSGMLAQCKEEFRVSEMSNYALKWHLSQANLGRSSLINTTNFPPDVY